MRQNYDIVIYWYLPNHSLLSLTNPISFLITVISSSEVSIFDSSNATHGTVSGQYMDTTPFDSKSVMGLLLFHRQSINISNAFSPI